jgi:hypothetical protein
MLLSGFLLKLIKHLKGKEMENNEIIVFGSSLEEDYYRKMLKKEEVKMVTIYRPQGHGKTECSVKGTISTESLTESLIERFNIEMESLTITTNKNTHAFSEIEESAKKIKPSEFDKPKSKFHK